jgi:hypothetical protein
MLDYVSGCKWPNSAQSIVVYMTALHLFEIIPCFFGGRYLFDFVSDAPRYDLRPTTKDAVKSSWNTASERYKGAII